MQPKQANRFVMTDNRKPSGTPSGNSADSPDGIQLGQLAAMIQAATRIVIFTGAGISTESGIADFRSPGGIWSKIKPIEFKSFVNDEETRLEDWRRRFHFQKTFDDAPLNDGHIAVAQIMASPKSKGLITQNIDGLHQRSGIDPANIIEIHGNGTAASCLDCLEPMSLTAARAQIAQTDKSPRCGACGGLVKSNVISFGQPMPVEKLIRAEQWSLDCDLFLVLGSSLVVQPAAGLPISAKNNGAQLAIINRDPTPLDPIADLVVHAGLGESLRFSLEKAGFPSMASK